MHRRDAIELGLTSADAKPLDTDGDGKINAIDEDSDNDGQTDKQEAGKDLDMDGVPDHLDTKFDTEVRANFRTFFFFRFVCTDQKRLG
jgi:hypothetical protein